MFISLKVLPISIHGHEIANLMNPDPSLLSFIVPSLEKAVFYW
jgi:hypothetical protein